MLRNGTDMLQYLIGVCEAVTTFHPRLPAHSLYIERVRCFTHVHIFGVPLPLG